MKKFYYYIVNNPLRMTLLACLTVFGFGLIVACQEQSISDACWMGGLIVAVMWLSEEVLTNTP